MTDWEVQATRAAEIARRVISCLQGTDFHHVSLSVGVVELGPEMDSETLFKHADEAMYMAKKSVGNRIRIHGE